MHFSGHARMLKGERIKIHQACHYLHHTSIKPHKEVTQLCIPPHKTYKKTALSDAFFCWLRGWDLFGLSPHPLAPARGCLSSIDINSKNFILKPARLVPFFSFEPHFFVSFKPIRRPKRNPRVK